MTQLSGGLAFLTRLVSPVESRRTFKLINYSNRRGTQTIPFEIVQESALFGRVDQKLNRLKVKTTNKKGKANSFTTKLCGMAAQRIGNLSDQSRRDEFDVSFIK